VTVPLAAKLLQVTPKAVDLMLAQLGGALPRELTGRTRYRAWGIVSSQKMPDQPLVVHAVARGTRPTSIH
jgi:hypothetical protein